LNVIEPSSNLKCVARLPVGNRGISQYTPGEFIYVVVHVHVHRRRFTIIYPIMEVSVRSFIHNSAHELFMYGMLRKKIENKIKVV
jgi:hypothetical protein